MLNYLILRFWLFGIEAIKFKRSWASTYSIIHFTGIGHITGNLLGCWIDHWGLRHKVGQPTTEGVHHSNRSRIISILQQINNKEHSQNLPECKAAEQWLCHCLEEKRCRASGTFEACPFVLGC